MTKAIYTSYNITRPPMLFGDQVMMKTIFDQLGLEETIGFRRGDEGAVVTMALHHNEDFIDNLNADLARLKWVVLILTANELTSDYYKDIKHPNMKIWLSTPKNSDSGVRFYPLGYPSKLEYIDVEKDIEWFFAGQITNQRRVECGAVLKDLPNGQLLGTNGFNQGYEYSQYVDYMSRAKIVPCPGGPATPDTYRLYEALEIGCVPIVDRHSGMGKYGGDYWEKIFGDYPFMTIDDWSTFPAAMKIELAQYDQRRKEIHDWWINKKQTIKQDLINDIKEVGGKI